MMIAGQNTPSYIVRIRSSSQDMSPVGVGVLISERYVLTCAHVISEALKLSDKDREIPRDNVQIDFPFLPACPAFNAEIIIWKPPVISISGGETDDIAILQLPSKPDGSIPANLLLTQDVNLTGYEFRVFGYPVGFPGGVWAYGTMHDQLPTGRFLVNKLEREGGIIVQRGFSGAPIEDRDQYGVMGIVVQAAKQDKIAFVIPIDSIASISPELGTLVYHSPYERLSSDINSLSRSGEYSAFQPLLERLRVYTNKKKYSHDVLCGIVHIIKNLQKEIKSMGNCQDCFEYVSFGFIPPEWNIQEIVCPANYDIFIKSVIHIFKNNRDQLDLNLGIPIPIVLVVMNEKEASELCSGDAFKGYPSKLEEDFEQFKTLLRKNGLNEWEKSYKDRSVAWRPFTGSKETIEQLIIRGLDTFESKAPLVPIFTEISTLNKECYRQTLKKMRENGCIVVLDAISMQHPSIQREFQRSLLDAFPNTIVVKITFIGSAIKFLKQFTVLFELHADIEFYKRLEMDGDLKCGHVDNAFDFDRWLKEQTPKLPLFGKEGVDIRTLFYKGA